MGLEYISQPQVFLGGLTALGPGIQGLTENYPLLTTYNYWTSTASVDTSAFPIPGFWSIYDGPNNSASFIVTVSGILQTPDTYTIDIINRLLTFNSVVSADTEIGVTQLATAAPSSQSFDYITAVSGEFVHANTINLSAQVGTVDSLYVTNLTAVSSVLEVVNITNYEVDGYTINGDLTVLQDANITGNITAADSIVTNVIATTLSTENINIYNSIGSGNVVPAVEVAGVLANCVSALAIDIDGVVLYLPLLSAA